MTDKTILLPPAPTGNGEAHYRVTMMTPKRRYLSYLRERWWAVLFCVVLAVGGTVTYETLSPETYTSYASLLVGDMQVNMGSVVTEESQTYYGTQIELLKSLPLRRDAYAKVAAGAPASDTAEVKVDVVRPMGTSILQLSATGRDPALTEHFLQALIEGYMDYKKEMRRSTLEDIVIILTEQLGKQQEALRGEQDKWVEFQRTNNVAVMEEEAKSAGLFLADLKMQLARLKLDRELLQEGLAPYNAVLQSGANAAHSTNASMEMAAPEMTASDFDDTDLRALWRQMAVLKSQKVERSKILNDRRNAEIERLELTTDLMEKQGMEERKAKLVDMENRANAISNAIPEWEKKALSLDELLSQNQRLKNNIQREQESYNRLLAMLQNVDVGRNVEHERLSIHQAPTPAQPTERHLALRIAIAIVGGVSLSCAVVFGWYLFDDRFLSVRDIKDQFGEPVLGLIPQVRTPKSKWQEALLQAHDSRLGYLESYRQLRSSLLLSAVNEERTKTVLVTSAMGGEGKATVAVNLARILCRSGLRVALVDADPHSNGLHQLIGSADHLGALDFLRGAADAASISQSTDEPGLTFVARGASEPALEGIYLRPQLSELLTHLCRSHDFVILHGAPILSTDDTALLAPAVDMVILVMRPFYSRSGTTQRSLEMLYQRRAKQVVFVLNRARADDLAGQFQRNRIIKNGTASNGKSPA